MVDGDKEALHKKTARIQRLKASLKILDYNPKRDFVGWGGEDIRRLARHARASTSTPVCQSSTPRRSRSRPWTSTTTASRTSASAGRTRSCSCRTAATASSRPPARLHRRRASGRVGRLQRRRPARPACSPRRPARGCSPTSARGSSATTRTGLPKEPAYNLTAAAWGDFDGDGKPDILLANGFHGLRLYRNIRRGGAEDRAAEVRRLARHRHVPRRQPGRQLQDRVPDREGEVHPEKEYKGKRNMPTKWARRTFKDGEVDAACPKSGRTARRTSTARSNAWPRRSCRSSIGTAATR